MSELMKEVLAKLNEAYHIGGWIEMRKRYASPQQWELEGPPAKKKAHDCWQSAKTTICSHLEALRPEIQNLKGADRDIWEAAIKVIEQEVEEEFEKQILE